MSEDKKTMYVINTTEEKSASETPKSRPYRKYVIVAVSCILVAAVILAAILVGMHLFSEQQKEIVRFSYSRDKNTKEEVTSDPNSNIVQYHVNSATYEMWVVNDFNRDIQALKIHSEMGTNCYLTPLNRTTANDPSKINPPSANQPTNVTYTLNYRSASTPISDSTFIGQTARDVCKGISTYWLYPSCEGPDSVSGRQKRGTVGVSVKYSGISIHISVSW